MSKTNPARGMRDLLPVDVRKREYVIGIIKQVYESYGYEPLETPAVENIETLMGKYGEEGNQLVFKILKRGEKLAESLGSLESKGSLESGSSGTSSTSVTSKTELADLALRYDLTVPLARVVADRRNELPKFFKRYQIQPVWRADRPARGRFREFYQCDVDAIGSESMLIEAELISAVDEILTRLGFEDYVIRLNHRKVLEGLLTSANIPSEIHAETLVALDKLDKIEREGVEREFAARGIADQSGKRLLDLFESVAKEKLAGVVTKTQSDRIIEIQKRFAQILDTSQSEDKFVGAVFGNLGALKLIEEFVENNNAGQAGINELEGIFTLLDPILRSKVRVDPSLARGLSYYTGTIIEINVPDLAGSLGGGGRYDGLIGMFGKEQIPACGFSLGLERILVVMDERGMFPPEIAESRAADVMVTIWNEETIPDSLKLADELRKQRLRVLVYPEADKLGKQMKYADTIRVPFVCILGPDEIEKGVAKLKNMRTGEETTGPAIEISPVIARSR